MSRLLTLILALALTILVFFSFTASAVNGTIDIGANDNNSRYPIGLDPSANGTNFPNFQAGGVYQQVYAKTAFSGPVTITRIAFASQAQLTSNPGNASYNFNIALGTTAASPNALSTNLAANRGPQLVQVFSGPLAANITDNDQFDVFIDITPFTYDPVNGNLLMEINFNAPVQFSGGSLLYFRAGADSRTSRAANPSGVAGGAFTDNFGLLTRFTSQSNTAPDALDDAATINEDSGANAISVLANDTDPDNDTLTITAVTQGGHGLTAITGGGSGLTYTPAADFFGTDAFAYTISDGHGGTDTANVNVTINAVNDSPSFNKGADQTIKEDAATQTVNGWATNISAGQGESGQTLDFIVTNDNNQLFSAQPAIAANGTLTYKSAPNAFGVATVSVKLHDNGGGTDTSAAQTFKITVKPVADLPSVTPANTIVNTQTTSGLIITRNPVDGPEVTHFKFFSITNGRLFQHDGVTEIPSGGVITAAEGQAGLKFTPDPDLYSPQSFFFFTMLAGVGPEQEDFTPNFLSVGIGVTCTEAQVFVVSNSNDSGPGSLRDVLNNACSGGKVTFDMSPGHVTSPITLTSGELAVGQEQTIAGPTDTSLVISGNNSSRVFNVNWWQANVKISDLTIRDGKANTGAGILSNGNLTIKNSTLTGNHAEGLNGLNGSGGALYAESGSLLITNSTISGNTAQGYGGGLFNQTDNATLMNVTITNNRADSNGDGLAYDGGIIQLGSHMNLRNSIVAGNFKGTGNTVSDLTGNASDPYAAGSRNNLIGVDDVSTGLDGNINLLGSLASPIVPLLGALADNGGPTKTHLLLQGSPAFKAGVNTLEGGNTTVLLSDQRGFSRASSGPIDIGAVEISYAISATAGTPQSATIGSAFAVPLQATVTEAGVPQSGILVTFAAPANGASGSFSGSATVSTDSNGVATAPVFTANSIVGGPYNVTASVAGGSSSAVFTLTNTAGTAQVTLGNLLQTFDGNPKSVSVTSNPAGLNIAVTYNGSAQAPTNGGTYAVTATVNDPSFIGQASGNLIIQPANQQITLGALTNKKFHDADFNTSATASSNLVVSFSASGNCAITGTQVHLTGAGTCTITAAQDGSNNYNPAAPVVRTFSIGKADQQITFAPLADKKVGDADFNIDATASSNLTVGLAAAGNCTLNGSQVHLTGAGQCTVTASQDGNADYNAVTPVARTFAIAKADQQITFEALANKTAGDADFNVTATASSNLGVAFSAVGNCSVAGTLVHLTGAGQCSITASQDGNADYNSASPVARTFSIAKADQQITFAAPADKKFGDVDFDVIATASSNLPVGLTATGNCSVSGARVHLIGAGPCTINASQDGNADYNTATPVARTFAVAKADQQITFAAPADRKFGDADFDVSAAASSKLNVALTAAGNCSVNGARVHLIGAGQCTINASQDGNADYNAATPVARTFAIAKADQQITFAAPADRKFGDADFDVSAAASSKLNVALTAAGNCSLTGARVHITGAGQCTITASQDGNADYNAATPVTRTLTVAKADQQITFAALANKTAGDADFKVTATASSGLAVTLAATGNCTLTGAQVHLTGAGTCAITASQDGNSDYSPAASVVRTFSISKADQQITFGALSNKAVGDADFNVNATASSGLAVSFSATGSCSVTGVQVHLTGAGICTITASQDGDTNSNAAAPVSRPFSIGKTDQQISFDVLPGKSFGDADFKVSANASSKLSVTFSASGNCTLAGTQVHLTGAGQCTINASQDGDDKYNPATSVARTFAVAKAAQQITFDVLPDKTIGDADFNLNAGASSSLPVAFVAEGNCTLTGTQVHLTAAGQCTVTAAQDGNSDYEPATAVRHTFTIADQVNNQTLFSFSSEVYHVTEKSGVLRVTIIRSGETSGSSTVDYATDDTGAAVDCAKLTGMASSRCDFNTAIGTLTFAPGETEKTFDVLINQDSYVESPFEAFTVKLSNPTGGAALGPLSSATVQIVDVSGGLTPNFNVVDDTRAFVRQQYHDFLNREPDAAGLAFWADNIDQCNDPARRPAGSTVDQCKQAMRINTSAAFFLSIEFSQTGGLVQAFYAAAFDRPKSLPSYLEFIRDTQAVGRGVVMGEGDWQQKLNENRDVFMKDFVMRPELVGLYPTVDSPAAYVNKLYLHAVGRQPTAGELEQAVNEFGGSASADDPGARARVLLQVTRAQDFAGEVHRRSFVQMQYIGYLRRNANELPDSTFDGFEFWLKKLNQFNGNFIEAEMVRAFVESGEYRARFGP